MYFYLGPISQCLGRWVGGWVGGWGASEMFLTNLSAIECRIRTRSRSVFNLPCNIMNL